MLTIWVSSFEKHLLLLFATPPFFPWQVLLHSRPALSTALYLLSHLCTSACICRCLYAQFTCVHAWRLVWCLLSLSALLLGSFQWAVSSCFQLDWLISNDICQQLSSVPRSEVQGSHTRVSLLPGFYMDGDDLNSTSHAYARKCFIHRVISSAPHLLT